MRVPLTIIVVLRLTLERFQPMDLRRRGLGAINLLACAVWNTTNHAFGRAVSVMTVLLVNHLGSGWIVLPDHGLGLVLGFVAYALTLDLGEYLFHRAEHAVPAMWSMHSLHHSDSHFDASTSVLHHWGAPVLQAVTTSVPLALLFKVPPIDLALWALMSNHVFLMHANLRWDFGRFWWLLTSPVYHRTHHSALLEHRDCNFASLFPVWDVVFGTRRRVDVHSFPPVGLGGGNEARGLLDIVLWPLLARTATTDAEPLDMAASGAELPTDEDGLHCSCPA